ncbi:MAG: chemotaxis protein CheA [Thermodesulfobacteriota bacterium]
MTDTPESQDLVQDLEQLALEVVMLAEDDLPGLGSFSNHLDQLKEKIDPSQAPEVGDLLKRLGEVSNRLILQEIQAAVQALELLNHGVTLLLEWTRDGNLPSTGETWEAYCRISEELGLTDGAPAVSRAAAPSTATFIDDPELVTNFLVEAQEHLESIETRLVFLEQNPEDLEAINAIFRPFHTIKGVAGFLNLAQIQECGHEVESLLDAVRNGNIPVTPALIDLVLAAVDLLKDMLADLREALVEGRGLMKFDLTGIFEMIKAIQDSPSDTPRLGEILVSKGDLEAEDLTEVLEKQKEQEPPKRLGEILVEEGKVPPQKVAQALVQQMADTRTVKEAQVAETVKVDLTKVDNLVDLMGELVIIQSQVKQNPKLQGLADQRLERDLGQMARITSDLQRISMSMRMVPISATFRKMVRLVRDLSHKMKKSVKLNLEGEETEIDRNMVEAIYDPLVHLVRNSLDHGLETPKQRQAKNKPKEGQLWLRAYHQGGNIIIEIEDDGQGLDREAILARAVERGLVDPNEQLTPTQIDNLIFEPGFSTAKVVTEVSGRGVGMDVVRQTIERMRGKVEIHSRPGEGSLFTMRLPLTLAIIDGMVVRVGEERYILPTVGVRETLRPAAEDYFTVEGKGELIQVRNRLIPLMRLHRLFEVGENDIHPTQALVMVVEHDGEQRALLVDEILGKQEIVIKSLGPIFQQLDGLAGGTILGDGRVGLILDLAGLYELEGGNHV